MNIVLGILLIVFGIEIYINPVYYSSKYSMTLDYSNIKVPFSIVLVFLGIALLWAHWKDNKNKKK
jgi:uncharacterized membrane protein